MLTPELEHPPRLETEVLPYIPGTSFVPLLIPSYPLPSFNVQKSKTNWHYRMLATTKRQENHFCDLHHNGLKHGERWAA
jgi:hypothetical protein